MDSPSVGYRRRISRRTISSQLPKIVLSRRTGFVLNRRPARLDFGDIRLLRFGITWSAFAPVDQGFPSSEDARNAFSRWFCLRHRRVLVGLAAVRPGNVLVRDHALFVVVSTVELPVKTKPPQPSVTTVRRRMKAETICVACFPNARAWYKRRVKPLRRLVWKTRSGAEYLWPPEPGWGLVFASLVDFMLSGLLQNLNDGLTQRFGNFGGCRAPF